MFFIMIKKQGNGNQPQHDTVSNNVWKAEFDNIEDDEK